MLRPAQSIYRLKKGSKTDGAEEKLSVDEAVDRLLQAVDSDGDGQCLLSETFCFFWPHEHEHTCSHVFHTLSAGHINMEEFLRGAQQDPWVLNMLKLDMNPARWVMDHRRRSAHF